MTKVCGYSPISTVHYVNGVIASKEDAEEISNQIAAITGGRAVAHHNPTTPALRIAQDTLFIGGGAGALLYAICSKKESKEKRNRDIAIGILGALFIAIGLIDYCQLQQEKNKKAEEIAASIRKDLGNPFATATFVLHSQGADIGLRAIHQLTLNERARLQVVTMGGMVAIPEGLVGKVVNFQHGSDIVSIAAQLVFNPMHSGEKKITPIKSNGYLLCHEAEIHMKHPQVRSSIKQFSDPKLVCYNF